MQEQNVLNFVPILNNPNIIPVLNNPDIITAFEEKIKEEVKVQITEIHSLQHICYAVIIVQPMSIKQNAIAYIKDIIPGAYNLLKEDCDIGDFKEHYHRDNELHKKFKKENVNDKLQEMITERSKTIEIEKEECEVKFEEGGEEPEVVGQYHELLLGLTNNNDIDLDAFYNILQNNATAHLGNFNYLEHEE